MATIASTHPFHRSYHDLISRLHNEELIFTSQQVLLRRSNVGGGARHVVRIDETKNACNILVGKPRVKKDILNA
jgi:hypothetical protein